MNIVIVYTILSSKLLSVSWFEGWFIGLQPFCWNETPVFHKILVPSPVLDFQSKTLGLFFQRPIHDPKAAGSSGKGITLPETNVAPENRPLEKEMPYWKPPFLGANC